MPHYLEMYLSSLSCSFSCMLSLFLSLSYCQYFELTRLVESHALSLFVLMYFIQLKNLLGHFNWLKKFHKTFFIFFLRMNLNLGLLQPVLYKAVFKTIFHWLDMIDSCIFQSYVSHNFNFFLFLYVFKEIISFMTL